MRQPDPQAASRSLGGSAEQLTGHACAEADGAARRPFLVDNSQLQAETLGLAFRSSKDPGAKTPDGSIVPWGETIFAVDEQDGWLRVEKLYLPIALQGTRVVVPVQMQAAAGSGVRAATGDGVEVVALSTEWAGVEDADGDEDPERLATEVFAARERRLTAGAEVLGEAGDDDILTFDAAIERVSNNTAGSYIPKQLSQEQLQACAEENDKIGSQLMDVISKLDTLLAPT